MSRPVAPGSLFLVCLPPDRETIGVPHPEPGRGRRRGGNKDSVAFVPLLFRAQPLWAWLLGPSQHVPSTPQVLRQPSPYSALNRLLGQAVQAEGHTESYGWEVAGLKFALSTGGLFADPTLGTIYPTILVSQPIVHHALGTQQWTR